MALCCWPVHSKFHPRSIIPKREEIPSSWPRSWKLKFPLKHSVICIRMKRTSSSMSPEFLHYLPTFMIESVFTSDHMRQSKPFGHFNHRPGIPGRASRIFNLYSAGAPESWRFQLEIITRYQSQFKIYRYKLLPSSFRVVFPSAGHSRSTV